MGLYDNHDHVVPSVMEERFDQLLSKLNDIEKQLSEKADDVVSFQLLQHRNELEELESRLHYIEMRMDILSQIDEAKLEVVESSYHRPKQPFFSKIASIFTL